MRLSKYGEILLFNSNGLVPDELSGHPDLFLCQLPDKSLICSKNTPEYIIKEFRKRNIKYQFGKSSVLNQKKCLSSYNAVFSNKYFIHRENYSDPMLVEKAIEFNCKFLNVKQSYTRCSLFIGDDFFITSDTGIYNALKGLFQNKFIINPKNKIRLKGYDYGLVGGIFGLDEKKIFIMGSLEFLDKEINEFLNENEYNIVELLDDFILDVGGIFIIEY